jgi:polyphosphate kinase
MNSLVDPKIIEMLYRASQAGVRIDLIIRGICCLRPGMPGISDNIRVISIVDKYLEHSRLAFFQNGDDPEVFLSSADWMPRNFKRRVELMFPIEDPQLKRRLIDGILGVVLADNVKARVLQPDGTYKRVEPPGPGEPVIRSQLEFQNMALELSEATPMARPSHASQGNYGNTP